MGQRDKIKSFGEFTGLSLKRDSHLLALSQATVADNVYVQSGSLKVRPGKVRSARWNGDPLTILGAISYFPATVNQRTTVIFAGDRIILSVV